MRTTERDRSAGLYAWIIAVVTVLLYLGTYSCVDGPRACEPAPSCDTPGCATPTPTLAWDYSQAWQNDLVGYRIYYREGNQPWDAARSWVAGCWIVLNEDDGSYSRTYCYGTDMDIPVQRFVERDFYEMEYAVKAIDRNEVESASYSNSVVICQPPIWRGGPYN